MPLTDANFLAVPLFMAIFIFMAGVYFPIHGFVKLYEFGNTGFVFFVFLPIVILGATLHELIHGICFVIFSDNKLSDLKFGAKWSTLTLYAHCQKPVTARAYKISTAMPGIILGIIPALISFVTGSFSLFMFAAIFTTAAAGDFIILLILKNVDKNIFVEDHPDNLGCFAYSDEKLDASAVQHYLLESKAVKIVKYIFFAVFILLGAALGFHLVRIYLL